MISPTCDVGIAGSITGRINCKTGLIWSWDTSSWFLSLTLVPWRKVGCMTDRVVARKVSLRSRDNDSSIVKVLLFTRGGHTVWRLINSRVEDVEHVIVNTGGSSLPPEFWEFTPEEEKSCK